MRTWVESGNGNFCMRCFAHAAGGTIPDHRSQLAGVDCLPVSFGLATGRAAAAAPRIPRTASPVAQRA
jgi:hypothetical protein